jgi:DNA ligase (NAD+)
MTADEYRSILKEHDAIYAAGKPIISDTEYDLLRSDFKLNYPDDPYFKTVGSPALKEREVELPFVMGGLTKVDKTDVIKWLKKSSDMIIVSEKMDGNSIEVTWEDHRVVFAASRGDGHIGEDRSEKAQFFVPPIPIKNRITCRGEVFLRGNSHIPMGYKNRRNGVAGLLRKDEYTVKDVQELHVKFYEVMEIQGSISQDLITELDRFNFMKNILGLPVVEHFRLWSISSESVEMLENALVQYKSQANYDIDGLVLTRNDSTFENTEYPEDKVKFKVNESAIKCNVIGIEWNITRTGLVRPVVLIEPTDIQGVTVSRATGFNWDYLNSNQIAPGATIGIVRSGDVIPYITEVFDGRTPNHPVICPACGELLKQYKNVDLCCPNQHCVGKNKYRIAYFFTTLGAEQITERTVEMLGVGTIEQMYLLTHRQITEREGFSSVKANTILKEIGKTLHTKPEKLLQAFGIPMIGEETAKTICRNIRFSRMFNKYTPLALGIGDVAAKSFNDHIQRYETLYNFLVNAHLELEEQKAGSLSGKVFALTGNGPLKRKIYIEMCEKKGGIVKSSVNKDTNYLVVADIKTNSTKIQNARKFGTKVISYDEFGMLLKG